MFAAAVAKMTNALFPIYRTIPAGGARVLNQLVGSGFFIDVNGTFVTVAHVVNRTVPGAAFMYRGRSPDHVQNPFLPIIEVARDDKKDILIGRIDLQLTHGLDLLSTQVPIGTSVCVAGYPLAKLATTPDGSLDVGAVRRYFQNAMVVDRATVTTEDGRIHEGFMMTEFSLFGMSGGPVTTTDGLVVGMQASITTPRVSEGAGGRKITIENAVAIGSEHIHALLAKVSTNAQPALPARSA